MAKRRAEAVACRAPYQHYLLHAPPSKRSRSDLERRDSRGSVFWRGSSGEKKRKWMGAEEGDEAGVSGKRPVGLKERWSPKEWGPVPAEGTTRREPEQRLLLLAGMATEAAALAGGDATGSRGQPEEHEDDVWHYNSFQFWKLPLPTIDLSDIQELEKGAITETRSSSSTALSEMET
ncbi:uncharacterized protein C9orf40 homolog [Candoia aspera]|uniref:uncharacterized protein C9orf40 homolog n=1 Tax=Candoia aspera TaxID=51853 RepID=UPI002FD817CB